ncbi:Delta(5) fatty acid desaturase [Escovopsis weberi]|uniref:Delta(5) fatty acid desaturase n=1 Tax=Escovopsis weberi TaxID=150374 RepID=A0A0M8N2Y6_ESCWE|nr:Delta(5) fatty acid desaturase [Escovopsis weberi]
MQHVWAPFLYGALTHFFKYKDVLSYLEEKNDKIPMNRMTDAEGWVFFLLYRCVVPLILSQCSALYVLTTFLACELMVSYIAAFVFESNHVVDDVLYEMPPEDEKYMALDWAEHQIKTTQDYGHGST